MKKHPIYGDAIPIKQFAQQVKHHSFTDYDGFGYFATATECDETIQVKPSQWKKLAVPDWATHVLWFNK